MNLVDQLEIDAGNAEYRIVQNNTSIPIFWTAPHELLQIVKAGMQGTNLLNIHSVQNAGVFVYGDITPTYFPKSELAIGEQRDQITVVLENPPLTKEDVDYDPKKRLIRLMLSPFAVQARRELVFLCSMKDPDGIRMGRFTIDRIAERRTIQMPAFKGNGYYTYQLRRRAKLPRPSLTAELQALAPTNPVDILNPDDLLALQTAGLASIATIETYLRTADKPRQAVITNKTGDVTAGTRKVVNLEGFDTDDDIPVHPRDVTNEQYRIYELFLRSSILGEPNDMDIIQSLGAEI